MAKNKKITANGSSPYSTTTSPYAEGNEQLNIYLQSNQAISEAEKFTMDLDENFREENGLNYWEEIRKTIGGFGENNSGDNSDLVKKINDLQAMNSDKEKEIADLRKKIIAGGDSGISSEQIELLEKEIENYKKIIQDNNAEITKAKESQFKISSLEREIDNYKTDLRMKELELLKGNQNNNSPYSPPQQQPTYVAPQQQPTYNIMPPAPNYFSFPIITPPTPQMTPYPFMPQPYPMYPQFNPYQNYFNPPMPPMSQPNNFVNNSMQCDDPSCEIHNGYQAFSEQHYCDDPDCPYIEY
ncbi:hypothetical protein NPX79_00220 [Spiroplasma endosymbiont of Anurida maritima]|uniref:hypothetical protein n=1 Tax=Spiroplasma endosymbiont of Anurida maritima TaxID=2967972 RepID=UPI0036D38C6E